MMADLLRDVVRALDSCSEGLTAAEIASRVRTSTKRVNRILYLYESEIFQKAESRRAPMWSLMLKSESSELVNPRHEEAASANLMVPLNDVLPWKCCTSCGSETDEVFCSEECRNRAQRTWAFRFLEIPDFASEADMIRFAFRNPTAELHSILEVGEEPSDRTIASDKRSLLELWLRHGRSVALAVESLKAGYAASRPESRRTECKTSTMIAVSNLSGLYIPEVLQFLKRTSRDITRSSLFDGNKLIKERDLSQNARANIKDIVERKQRLNHAIQSRVVDRLTLEYFGFSNELAEAVGFKRPVSVQQLEYQSRTSGASISRENANRIEDLLLAIATHPFLPTEEIVENLEVDFPELYISASPHFRRRLLEVLQRPTTRKVSPRRSRALRLLIAIEGVSAGLTLEAIGEKLGVSRERVRQILEPISAQLGADSIYQLRDLINTESKRQVRRRSLIDSGVMDSIAIFIRNHPGISRPELVEWFPDNRAQVDAACRKHQALLLETYPLEPDDERLDRVDVMASLKAASILRFPLTGVAYDQLLSDGLVSGVTRPRILQIYGTWAEACARAEVLCGEPLKNVTYVRRFSEQELLQVVGRFLLDEDSQGRSGAMHCYEPWKFRQELSELLPSSGTIRNHINSSWKRVKELALLEMRGFWHSEERGV